MYKDNTFVHSNICRHANKMALSIEVIQLRSPAMKA